MAKSARNRSAATIGYVRVSTEEQANSGLGLDSQRSVIEREAAAHEWELREIVSDEGLSAKSVAGRPGLARCLNLLDSGEASVLVVHKLDRLAPERWGLRRSRPSGREARLGHFHFRSGDRHDHSNWGAHGQYLGVCGQVGTPDHQSTHKGRSRGSQGTGRQAGETSTATYRHLQPNPRRAIKRLHAASDSHWSECGIGSHSERSEVDPCHSTQDHTPRIIGRVTDICPKSVFGTLPRWCSSTAISISDKRTSVHYVITGLLISTYEHIGDSSYVSPDAPVSLLKVLFRYFPSRVPNWRLIVMRSHDHVAESVSDAQTKSIRKHPPTTVPEGGE